MTALQGVASLLMPTRCAGCGATDRVVCALCVATAFSFQPRRVRRGSLEFYCAVEYSGVARRIIVSFKNGARIDIARALAGPFRAAIVASLAGAPEAELAVVPQRPTGYRTRGYHPVVVLARRAGFRPSRVLVSAAGRWDQVGLSRSDRVKNLAGAFRSRSDLDGREFLLVDDIVTTGATIREGVRAITAAGGNVVGVAALAETPRLRG